MTIHTQISAVFFSFIVFVFLSTQVNLLTSWYLARCSSQSICAVSPQSSDISCHKVCHHKPHHATVPAWCHAKQKWRFTAKMGLCSHYACPFCHFHLLLCFSALAPSVCPSASLFSLALLFFFSYYSLLITIYFPCCFLSFLRLGFHASQTLPG